MIDDAKTLCLFILFVPHHLPGNGVALLDHHSIFNPLTPLYFEHHIYHPPLLPILIIIRLLLIIPRLLLLFLILLLLHILSSAPPPLLLPSFYKTGFNAIRATSHMMFKQHHLHCGQHPCIILNMSIGQENTGCKGG